MLSLLYGVLCQGFAFLPEDRPLGVAEFLMLLTGGGKSRTPPVPFITGWGRHEVQALQQDVAESLGFTVKFRDRLLENKAKIWRDRFRQQSPEPNVSEEFRAEIFSDTILAGPEMVVVPPGQFLMCASKGQTKDDAERCQDRVIIDRPFALASVALSWNWFLLYLAYCKGEFLSVGRSNGNHPATGMAWEDAVEFCAWLSEQTSQHYRLPSEAEWKYACSAGTVAVHQWNDEEREYRKRTVPVKSGEASPWGLYQMYGNVDEWVVSDWWENNESDDTHRVVKWVGWHGKPRCIPSAFHYRESPEDEGFRLQGFRIARDF